MTKLPTTGSWKRSKKGNYWFQREDGLRITIYRRRDHRFGIVFQKDGELPRYESESWDMEEAAMRYVDCYIRF